MSLASWMQRVVFRSSAESDLLRIIARQKKKARTLLAGDFAILFNFSADLWRIAKQLPPPELFPPCDLVLDRVIRFHWHGSSYTLEKLFDDDGDECISLNQNGTRVLCAAYRDHKKIHAFLEGPWIQDLQALIPHLTRFLTEVAAWKAQKEHEKRLIDLRERFAALQTPHEKANTRRLTQPRIDRAMLGEAAAGSQQAVRHGRQPLLP